MHDTMEIESALNSAILAKLLEYPDGMSADHLTVALDRFSPDAITRGLAKLLQDGKVFQGGQGWWYVEDNACLTPVTPAPSPAQEPTPAPAPDPALTRVTPTPPPKPRPAPSKPVSHPFKFKPLKLRPRLREWLSARNEQHAPVTMKELADDFGVSRKALNDAILDILPALDPDQAALLRTTVIRGTPIGAKDKAPAVPAPAAVTPEPAVQTHATHTTDWLGEMRQCISSAMTTIELPPRRHIWRDTLDGIDRLFAEMGIDAAHRSRADLREISEWLSRD